MQQFITKVHGKGSCVEDDGKSDRWHINPQRMVRIHHAAVTSCALHPSCPLISHLLRPSGAALLTMQKLAAAATFLACKLEECTRVRVREIVMVFDRLWKRRDNAPLTLIEPGTKVSRWSCGWAN